MPNEEEEKRYNYLSISIYIFIILWASRSSLLSKLHYIYDNLQNKLKTCKIQKFT